MVAIVLPNNQFALQLPKSGVVVRAGGDKVGRVGGEGAVPNPSLVTVQLLFQLKAFVLASAVRFRVDRGLLGTLKIDLPNASGVVG